MGVLKEEMLKRGCKVTAIEKDPVLAERLAASLCNPPNLTVIAGDALDVIYQASKKSDNPLSTSTSNLGLLFTPSGRTCASPRGSCT